MLRFRSAMTKWLVATGLAAACLAFGLEAWLHAHATESKVSARSYFGQDGRLDEWQALGGTWALDGDALHNNSDERGAKLLTGSPTWSDYALTADIRFLKERGDMGLIVRSNDEMQGTDNYKGYYVGLRVSDGSIILGRSEYAWVEAQPVPMPGGVHASVWYRLRVIAYGCSITASAQNMFTNQTGWVAFEDRSCVRTGRIGLRSVDSGGMWRNVAIAPAVRADYLQLRQHAASIERPIVYQGPPWWTPWHVSMLFAGALGLALLVQLVYFRIVQWKALTIMQERERLAHQIHDTMAQSFAGVGYQIQGIRRSVLRGDHPDSRHIAEQLGVTYQLVRRCHREASTTIAMLSASSPLTVQNLLQALADTASRIAGDQIRTTTRLDGDSIPLNLQVTDALLHIGQEAIANAVAHSEPSVMTITLGYEGGNVELVVEDNGRGFECTPETAGFGILGMQKRARDIAGTLCILSTVGCGTQVRVKARLRKASLQGRVLGVIRQRFTSAP